MPHQEGPGGVQTQEVGHGGQHVGGGRHLVDLGRLDAVGPDEEVRVLEHVHVVHALELHVQGVVHHVVVVVVGVEDQDGVLVVAALPELVHQLPDEAVGLHGPGHGVDVVAVGAFGGGLGSVFVLLVDDVVLAVRPVGRVGDDEGEEGAFLRHGIEAVDELAVQLVLVHVQGTAAVVFLIAQVAVDVLPVVDVPLAVVEGASGVAGLAEQVGQGEGVVVVGVHRGGDAAGGGQEAGVGHELGVEGPGGDIGRGVVVGEGNALGLELREVGHVLRLEHPGVQGLQLDHDDVFALEQTRVVVGLFGVLIGGDIVLHLLPLVVAHGVGGEDLADEIPHGVLVQSAELQGVGGVAELMVGGALRVFLGVVPDHRIHHGEEMVVGKGDDPRPQHCRHDAQDHRQLHRLGRNDLQQTAGGHHQQDGDRGPRHHLQRDVDVRGLHEAPRSPVGQHGEGEEAAEHAHKAAVGHGDGDEGHQRHAPHEPAGHLRQAEHQPRKDQRPAQGKEPRRSILHPHDARRAVGVAQGEVQHEIGQEKGDDVEIGADARHIFGIQPILGEALPEGQALVLPRQLPCGFSLLFFGR